LYSIYDKEAWVTSNSSHLINSQKFEEGFNLRPVIIFLFLICLPQLSYSDKALELNLFGSINNYDMVEFHRVDFNANNGKGIFLEPRIIINKHIFLVNCQYLKLNFKKDEYLGEKTSLTVLALGYGINIFQFKIKKIEYDIPIIINLGICKGEMVEYLKYYSHSNTVEKRRFVDRFSFSKNIYIENNFIYRRFSIKLQVGLRFADSYSRSTETFTEVRDVYPDWSGRYFAVGVGYTLKHFKSATTHEYPYLVHR